MIRTINVEDAMVVSLEGDKIVIIGKSVDNDLMVAAHNDGTSIRSLWSDTKTFSANRLVSMLRRNDYEFPTSSGWEWMSANDLL